MILRLWYSSGISVRVISTPLGEFGIVYKGYLKNQFTESANETVAVKTLKGTDVR